MGKAKSVKCELTAANLLRLLTSELTVSVPEAGKALAGLSKNASYEVAARDKAIAGIPVLDVGGKKRLATAPIRKVLGTRCLGGGRPRVGPADFLPPPGPWQGRQTRSLLNAEYELCLSASTLSVAE